MRLLPLALLAVAAPAVAQPRPSSSEPDKLELDVSEVASFVAGPDHADVRRVTIRGCGTLADLAPFAGLPAGIAIRIGTTDCIVVDRLTGVERAASLVSLAVHRDVSALANAKLLRVLELHGGPQPIASLVATPIPAVTQLWLNLYKDAPADVQMLLAGGLPSKLENLTLVIDHVPSLPSLPDLQSLTVWSTSARRSDLRFLLAVPFLRSLTLGGIAYADVTPILSLHDLEHLDLTGICRIDTRPLWRLRKLTRLKVSKDVLDSDLPVRPGLDITRSKGSTCDPPRR